MKEEPEYNIPSPTWIWPAIIGLFLGGMVRQCEISDTNDRIDRIERVLFEELVQPDTLDPNLKVFSLDSIAKPGNSMMKP